MIKVKDIDGKEIRGLFRGENGSLVMHDNKLLEKYLREKSIKEQQQEKIKSLESEVSELKSMLETLMQKMK